MVGIKRKTHFCRQVWHSVAVAALSLSLGWAAPASAKNVRQSKPTTTKSAVAKPVARPAAKAAQVLRKSAAPARKVRTRVAVKAAPVTRVSAPAVRNVAALAAAPLVPISVKAASAVPLKPSATVAAASGATGASFGQIYGLHHTPDPLELKSSVALVMDQDTNEIVLAKNSDAVLPIASLTKLMTAAVIVEARLPMDESIMITSDDVDTEKNSSSRLTVGASLSRGDCCTWH